MSNRPFPPLGSPCTLCPPLGFPCIFCLHTRHTAQIITLWYRAKQGAERRTLHFAPERLPAWPSWIRPHQAHFFPDWSPREWRPRGTFSPRFFCWPFPGKHHSFWAFRPLSPSRWPSPPEPWCGSVRFRQALRRHHPQSYAPSTPLRTGPIPRLCERRRAFACLRRHRLRWQLDLGGWGASVWDVAGDSFLIWL